MKYLDEQLQNQRRLSEKRGAVWPPDELMNVGEFVDYIRQMKAFLDMEIQEILDSVDPTGEVQKPWKAHHSNSSRANLELTPELKAEAIDAQLFLMNILLASGVHAGNFNELMEAAQRKVADRIESGY